MSQPDDGSPPSPGFVIPRWVSRLLVGAPFAGAVVVLLGVALIGVPMLWRSVTPLDGRLLPAAEQELTAAKTEHLAIVHVVENCLASEDGSRKPAARYAFEAVDDLKPTARPAAFEEQRPNAPGYLDDVLYLSHAIVGARTDLAGRSVLEELVSEVFEWTIVATGLFTTILISVKTFANMRSQGYMTMAVAAIVLSSLGTAVATLNSYYTPRLTYDQTQRSLANLRNMHWNLASEMLRDRNACADKADWTTWRPRHLHDLTSTFIAIMNTSTRSVSGSDEGLMQGQGPTQDLDGGLASTPKRQAKAAPELQAAGSDLQ